MKVIAVYGSNRKDSQSEIVLDEMVRGAKEAGHEVAVYHIPALHIYGCLACGQCQKNSCDCVIEDGLKDYWKDLHTCGALLLSAPNYMGQVSGQMISFMNRHYCLSSNRVGRLKNPVKLAGVFAQGAPVAAGIYDSSYNWYLSVFTGSGMTLADRIVVGAGSDLSDGGEILKKARQIGKNL